MVNPPPIEYKEKNMAPKNKTNYNPTPIYNRKMLRNIIRERAIALKGYHRVNDYMSAAFKEIMDKKENE